MEYEYWTTGLPKPATLPESCEYWAFDEEWMPCTKPPVEWGRYARRWPKGPAKVYLAWYDVGYDGSNPDLIGVYGSQAAANAAVAEHKVTHSPAVNLEYGQWPEWTVKEEEVHA